MSWESSAHYYRLINEGVRDRLGGHHSADLILRSLDFAPIAARQHDDDWDALADAMRAAARDLVAAGAEAIVLCTNTMHRVADAIEGEGVPLLHIADVTAAAIRAAGLNRVALLGTVFTMEQPFLRDRLAPAVIVPDADDRATVHRIIYDELVRGTVDPASRAAYRDVMARLAGRGAEGIVLGCTEIMMLVGPEDAAVPLFDTTTLHAAAAVDWMLA